MFQQNTYQAKRNSPHWFPQDAAHAPKWYTVDASGQTVGRIASVLAKVITGKHKPAYTQHVDTGDFVVVTNADKIKFTGNKWKGKLYRDHSGWVSGLKTKTATEMLERHPEEILKRAVWGMTNKSSLARHQMVKLKLFMAGEVHPHTAQNPQPLPASVTRRSDLEKK